MLGKITQTLLSIATCSIACSVIDAGEAYARRGTFDFKPCGKAADAIVIKFSCILQQKQLARPAVDDVSDECHFAACLCLNGTAVGILVCCFRCTELISSCDAVHVAVSITFVERTVISCKYAILIVVAPAQVTKGNMTKLGSHCKSEA